ncbi:hypothetical protein J5N97_029840 [Dioscorea zingiberensis]|uniref:Uncharacterized protein n=1 Tax=Dioscorea zingiberensis TaxID=325984 RepID=A0A9D5H3K1_9LILI|nr:hypothetical protein J5N97_029840 [Dioscorea zingiberensis]
MVLHLLLVGKLKLLASSHIRWQQYFLSAFILPFSVKIAIAAAGGFSSFSLSDMVFHLRLFFFRLNRIFSHSTVASNDHRRWERTLRLLHERAGGSPAGEDTTIHAISMFAL